MPKSYAWFRRRRVAPCLRSTSSNFWKEAQPTYPFSQETFYSCPTARPRLLRTDLFKPSQLPSPAWPSTEGISCMDSFHGQPDPSKSLAVTHAYAEGKPQIRYG